MHWDIFVLLFQDWCKPRARHGLISLYFWCSDGMGFKFQEFRVFWTPGGKTLVMLGEQASQFNGVDTLTLL